MATDRLTDRQVKSFVATCRTAGTAGKKLFDGAGMFLTVTPAGTGAWRVKYQFAGKERVYAIGTYPTIGLAGARVERGAIKEHLRAGRDPVQARRINRAERIVSSEMTFEVVARDWMANKKREWSPTHFTKSTQAIERDLLPRLGRLPVSEITPAMVATTIEAIVKRGARETAGKVLWSCNAIFQLAQARGLCRDNPAVPARAVLPRRKREVHRPAATEWKAIGDILHRAAAANLTRAVYMAHRLIAFTAVRIGNAVAADWREFDLDTEIPTWVIARRKMKAQDRAHDHKVLLGPELVKELRAWRGIVGGKGFLFPSPAGNAKRPHISRESIEKAYRVTLDLGDKHTPHGWRAALSTLARDSGLFERDVVEITLDHVHDTEVVRAYDRGERLEQRIRLANWWSTQLTQAESAAREA